MAVAAKLTGAVLGLALNVVAARTLSVEGYGLFLLGLTTALLLSAFSSAGLPLAAMRFLPAYLARGDGASAARFKRTSIAVTWAGAALAIGVGLGVLWLLRTSLDPAVRAVILASAPVMLVFALAQTYTALLQARMRVTDADVIFNILRPALAVAAVLGVAAWWPGGLTPATVLWLVAATAATALSVLALHLRRVERASPPPPQAADPAGPATGEGWREWLASGAVILLVLSGAALNERLDILMVSALAGSAETAIYGAASRFALISLLVVSAVGAYFLPRFSAAWSGRDIAAARRTAVLAARTAAALALGVLVALAVLGPFGLALFGPDYLAGQTTMLILAAAFLGLAAFGQSGGIAVIAGRPGVALRATVAGLAVNVALNLVLTPRFGSEGAATATLVALTVAAAYAWAWCRRRLGVSTWAFARLR